MPVLIHTHPLGAHTYGWDKASVSTAHTAAGLAPNCSRGSGVGHWCGATYVTPPMLSNTPAGIAVIS